MFSQENHTSTGLWQKYRRNPYRKLTVLAFIAFVGIENVPAQSLDLAIDSHGISFGNSRQFTGLRFNIIDSDVEKINGVNITVLKARNNNEAEVNGLSLGLVGPQAGSLRGVQIGGLGVGADKELAGVSLGILGAGSGGTLRGITLGGLGAGAGGDIHGLTVGLLGAGAGEDIRGVTIGGLGAGAGGNVTGITLGGLGAGAGGDVTGITIGGLGAGAGGSLRGISLGLLGAGAGGDLTGIAVGGFGAGCGGALKGIALAGLDVNASGIRGISCAVGRVKSKETDGKEGSLTGCSISAFNTIEGTVHGISVGIVNYAYRMKGIQIGVVNYVRDNPRHLKILPVFNARFK